MAGDFPEWLLPSLQGEFGDALVTEMQALAQRAPLDLRVNPLKGTRRDALAALSPLIANFPPGIGLDYRPVVWTPSSIAERPCPV